MFQVMGRPGLRPVGANRKRKVPKMGGGPGRGGLALPGLWGTWQAKRGLH